jgi:putative DNA primase/helicase
VSEESIKHSLDGAQVADAATLLRSEVERLSKLDHAGYLVERKQIAGRYKIPAAELDKLVNAAHPPTPGAQREWLAPPAPPPWPELVEGAALLDDVCDFIRRFVILDEHALNAITLWIAFAHCFAVAETSPRLRITSPEKRCGKSCLLEVLNVLSPRPLSASNISPSAVFRVIELEHCTLLIDEADSFLRDNEDMRNLINSGHTPEFAFVIRSVPIGDKAWEPKRFSTWCPMVIAGIGKLADTVEDRSIRIAMRRKLRADKVERLTRRNKGVREEASALASKLARFAGDSLEKLSSAKPLIPDALNDRAADNWEHLLAIADLAGDHWPTRARATALALSGSHEDANDDSLRARLLADIQHILECSKEAEISSADLCKALVDIETAPWSELNRGKPMTPARLSRMLKDFEIYVGKVHGGKARGYRKSDFVDAFERYLSSVPDDQSVQVSETLGREGASVLSEVSGADIADTLKSEETSTERGTSDTLTLSKPRISSKDEALQPRCAERERFEL